MRFARRGLCALRIVRILRVGRGGWIRRRRTRLRQDGKRRDQKRSRRDTRKQYRMSHSFLPNGLGNQRESGRFGAVAGTFILLLRACVSGDFHLNTRTHRQAVYAERGAGGEAFLLEIRDIDLVEGRPFLHVGQKHLALEHVVE